MKQIREGIFETNSSSVHAICIYNLGGEPLKAAENSNVKHIDFNFGEYGWEHETLSSIDEKASYLWTAIESCEMNLEESAKKIEEFLEPFGITASFQFYNDKEKKQGYADYGYIDHGGETSTAVNFIMKSREAFCKYMFLDSFIETGNDNCDECPNEEATETLGSEYLVFIKGN